MHFCGMWEKAGVPEQNPCEHGENVPTPQRQWLQWGIDYFPHQYYNEMMLNKMTLRMNPVYTYIHFIYAVCGNKPAL